MSGFPKITVSTVEVVIASTAGKHVIQAQTTSPGWRVINEFPFALTAKAGLDVMGMVSAAGLSLNLRLVDASTGAVVGSAVSIQQTSPTRAKGGQITLTGGKVYQIQAECIGAVSDTNFGTVQAAAVSD